MLAAMIQRRRARISYRGGRGYSVFSRPPMVGGGIGNVWRRKRSGSGGWSPPMESRGKAPVGGQRRSLVKMNIFYKLQEILSDAEHNKTI